MGSIIVHAWYDWTGCGEPEADDERIPVDIELGFWYRSDKPIATPLWSVRTGISGAAVNPYVESGQWQAWLLSIYTESADLYMCGGTTWNTLVEIGFPSVVEVRFGRWQTTPTATVTP